MNTPTLLDLRGIGREFPSSAGAIPVLRNFNLTLDPGERLVILGPSGCGKTTLLHLIALLDRPDSGEVVWQGEDTNRWDETRRSRHRAEAIGMVFQRFHTLPHRSVRENLRLRLRYSPPAAPDPAREDALLAEIGLLSRADHPARLLSGGELQRLCIARACLLKPRLLLADEPTGNLDEANASIVRSLFTRLADPDTAVIVATHDPRWSEFATRVIDLGAPSVLSAVPTPPAATITRAKPRLPALHTLTLSLTCFAAALLLGAALRLLTSASAETQRLLRAWPAQSCTLRFAESPHASDLLRILPLWPPARFYGYRKEGNTLWLDGFPPADFFQGSGHGLPPDFLAEGRRAALVSRNYAAKHSSQPGQTLEHGGHVFHIAGVGDFPYDADLILPARAIAGPTPDTWHILAPASEIAPLLYAPEFADLRVTLIDHDLRRQEIRGPFRRLRLSLQALGGVIALLTGLVIHSLLSANVRERRAEIGLRRSLGARPADIRSLFLREAALTGGISAAAGLLPWILAVPMFHVFAGYALLLLWILANAVFPAQRAAELPPSESLRGA